MNSDAGASSRGGAGGDSATESSDEEQEESSSSLSQKQTEDALDNFREKWKRELETSKQQIQTKEKKNTKEEQDAENTDILGFEKDEAVFQKNEFDLPKGVFEAKKNCEEAFLNGIEMERSGQLYEAIQFYRRAVQLVPDIEFKLDTKTKSKAKEYQESEENFKEKTEKQLSDDESNDDDDDSFDEDGDIKDLVNHIQRKFSKDHQICIPKIEQKDIHISALPMEIILYILRWVVSNDLDLRSLEMCSRTSRGFYLCCRDSEIWRLACVRAWGLNLGGLPNGYNSWRQMFIERAHLQFNGCYISKTSYLRHGENSFQDQFYRPWHIVTYYRYLRFFPDGLVLMLTTADEPSQCVGQLKYRTTKSPAVLSGHYRLKDDKVTIVVYRQDMPKNNPVYKRNRKREAFQDNSAQTFHLEMQIQHYKKQKNIQLVWTGYSVYTRNRNGNESTCKFELIGNRFPPLWFSRVKAILQNLTVLCSNYVPNF